MIKDYKGEMPNNVTTPDKAKAKKPFYKDWKFWVLTGLMTLFGACSIYGLVLGSQYVKAIERASHIIADAQSGSVSDSQLQKTRHNLATPAGGADHFDFENHFSGGWSGDAFFRVDTGANVVSNQLPVYIPCWRITIATDQTRANLVFPLSSSGYTTISPTDYIKDYRTNASMSWWTPTLNYVISPQQPLHFYGTFYYYPATQFYDDGYSAGQSEGYSEGYAEGSADGYEDGYQEGFDDGADSQANEQTIKVLLAPDFTGDRIQYTYTLDGAEVGTGYLSNTNQHYQNHVEFSRPAGGQHKAVLNLYSDNDEPIKIAYDTYTGTLGETRYLWYQKSNAYDWSTSQWYVPTYWAEARFLVTGYGIYDQGFTEDYFFNLDPQYNDRAKVGAYSEGYDAGYNDAVESGDAYDAGYDSGYADGQAQGETDGFNRGVAVGSSGSQSLAMMFKTAFQLPFDQLYRFLNFNLLGINFLSLFTALISVSIGIMVIKKVL